MVDGTRLCGDGGGGGDDSDVKIDLGRRSRGCCPSSSPAQDDRRRDYYFVAAIIIIIIIIFSSRYGVYLYLYRVVSKRRREICRFTRSFFPPRRGVVGSCGMWRRRRRGETRRRGDGERRKKSERLKNKHGDYNEFDNELYGTMDNIYAARWEEEAMRYIGLGSRRLEGKTKEI